jgi:hypothetical protein
VLALYFVTDYFLDALISAEFVRKANIFLLGTQEDGPALLSAW